MCRYGPLDVALERFFSAIAWFDLRSLGCCDVPLAWCKFRSTSWISLTAQGLNVGHDTVYIYFLQALYGAVDRAGQLSRTYFFFTTDHGLHMGQFNLGPCKRQSVEIYAMGPLPLQLEGSASALVPFALCC
jgi:hypothetical protein